MTWRSCHMNLRLVSTFVQVQEEFCNGSMGGKVSQVSQLCTKGGDTLLQKQNFVTTVTTDIGKGLSPDGFKGEKIRSNKHTQL